MKRTWLIVVILFQSLLMSCATPAWKKYPTKASPDYSCFYGGAEGGPHYYIWKCLDGKRVVIKQTSWGPFVSSAERYESSCDGKTEIENEQKLEDGQKYCGNKGIWPIEP